MGSLLTTALGFVLRPLFRAWFTLTFLAMIATTSVTLHVGNFILRLLGVSPETRAGLSSTFCSYTFHTMLLCNPQIRIETHDGKPLPWDELFEKGTRPPFILINHTSQLDAFVYSASIPMHAILKMRTMAKSSLFKTPLFGALMQYCGHFPVFFNSSKVGDFSVDKEAQAKVTDQMKAHIAGGGALALYPEGQVNRVDARFLQEFRRGSLGMARDNNMELWGFLHAGIEDAWPPLDTFGGLPCVIKLKLFKLPPVPKELELPEYTDRVKAILQEELSKMYASSEFSSKFEDDKKRKNNDSSEDQQGKVPRTKEE